MKNASRWKYFYAFTLVVDFIQVVLYFIFGSGIAVNRIISLCMVFILPLLLELAGLKPRFLALAATFTAEELPLVDIVPSWTIYIWFVKKGWEAEQKILKKAPVLAKVADVATARKQPLVKDGVRAPIGRDTI